MGFLRVAIAMLALGGVALAQPGPNEKQRVQAGELVKKAIARSQAGDHATAIDLYLQAYQIAPMAILLSNIATEFQQEGKPVDALKYFCWYLRDDPTGTNTTYATTNARALQIQLGREVDEKDVCHPIEHAKPVEPPPPVEPPKPNPAPPSIGPVMPPLPPPGDGHRSTLQTAGLVVGGVGIAALGVGVYYGVAGYELSNKISDHCPTTPCTVKWEQDIRTEESNGHTDNVMQTTFMIAGGVAIATGAVLYYVGRRKPDEHLVPVMLEPTVTPTSAGLSLAGRF
jgi:hypothetical protein